MLKKITRFRFYFRHFRDNYGYSVISAAGEAWRYAGAGY
jgi:hypothetical protein